MEACNIKLLLYLYVLPLVDPWYGVISTEHNAVLYTVYLTGSYLSDFLIIISYDSWHIKCQIWAYVFFFARPQEKLILGFITGKIKLLDMCSHLKGLRYNLLISSDNLRILQAIEKRHWIYILTFFFNYFSSWKEAL